MKNTALILLLLLLSYNSFSQQEADGFSLEIKLNPELAYVNLAFMEPSFKGTLSGGVNVEKGINQYLKVGVGLQFKNRGVQYELDETDYQGDIIGKRKIKERVNYLSAPLFIKGKLNNFYGTLGISLDIFLTSSNGYFLWEENIRKVNSSFYTAIGYHLNLKEQLFLNMEASFNPMIFSITNNDGPHAYNFGLGFGLGFRL